MKKKFFLITLIFFFLTSKSFAYSTDPKQFIAEIVEEAKKILVATNTKDFKTQKLSEMALKVVDIKGVGYYSIGNYRKNLSEKQLVEYLNLFEKYFLKSFTSRLTDYSDPKIEVLDVEVLNEKCNANIWPDRPVIRERRRPLAIYKGQKEIFRFCYRYSCKYFRSF